MAIVLRHDSRPDEDMPGGGGTPKPAETKPRRTFPPRPVAEPESVESAHPRLAKRFKKTLSALAK